MARFDGYLRRVAAHTLLAASAGGLLGALDGAITSPSRDVTAVLVAAWVGMGCLALVIAPLGVLQATLERFALFAIRGRPAPAWWKRLTSPEHEGSAPIVARTHAGAALGLSTFGFVLALVWKVDSGLVVIQDHAFRRLLLVLAVAVFIVGGAVWLLVVSAPATRWFSYLDRRVGLPWPHSNPRALPVYISIALLVPSFVVAVLLLVKYGNELTIFTRPIGFVLLVQFQLFIYIVLRKLGRIAGRVLIGSGIVVGAVTIIAVPFVLPLSKVGKAGASAGIFTRPALTLLTKAFDGDGDGFSRYYLGGDCDPNDPTMHVGAVDMPGNGKDENCDGFDTPPDAPIPRPSLFAEPPKPAQIGRYNVLWIVVDAMRPASMSVYGAQRQTTPMLTQFARSAVVFENAYVQSTTTHLSLTCMLTGKTADSIEWEYKGDPRRLESSEKHLTLAERLKPLGYQNVAIASRFIARLPSILRGFHVIVSDHRSELRYDGPGATHAAIRELHNRDEVERKSRPFFFLVYYEDPHKPYDAHGPEFPSYGPGELDRYEGEVAFVDRYLGFLFDHLRLNREIWDNTIVIVTADHGEEFGEHGGLTHGKNCREMSTRVPLIVKIPGIEATRVRHRVSLSDIVPTVMELVGAAGERGDLDGRSLLSTLSPGASEEPSFCAIMNQGGNLRGKPFFQRSVRFGSRVLIHDVLSDELALFDAEQDRLERTNLIQKQEEAVTVRYMKRLLDWNSTGNIFRRQLDE